MKDNKSTAVYEEADKYSGKSTYIQQTCAICSVNHDYKLRGRTVMCVCGAYLVEGSKGKLKRVG